MTEKEEIVEGIRNALLRGYSIDEAIRSFINAGYPEADVRDSAEALGKGVLDIEKKAYIVEEEPEKKGFFSKIFSKKPELTGKEKPRIFNKKIIILIAVLLVLIGVLLYLILTGKLF